MIAQSVGDTSRVGVVRRHNSVHPWDEHTGNESNDIQHQHQHHHHHNSNQHVRRPIHDDDDDMVNRHDDADDDNDDENDEYLVSCRCESAKVISTLLSCLRNVATTTSGGGGSSSLYGSNGGGSGGNHHNNTSLVSSTQNISSYSVRSSRRNQSNASSSSSSSLQPVTVYCNATNMTFHICNTSKQIQASVDLPSNIFSDYSVATTSISSCITSTTTNGDTNDVANDNQVVGGEFCINLATLLECLHCLGTHNLDTTKLCFSYNTTQELFKLELLEELSGILSTASIPGMLSPDSDYIEDGDDPNQSHETRLYSLAHAFRQSEKYIRVIIQSESLNELITELDYIAGGTMVNVTYDQHQFMISVIGYLGECQIVLPARGIHVISLEAPETSIDEIPPTWTYPLHAFMESMRGLEIADETCITINTAGMMAIQHQVIQRDRTTDVTPSFIDFILCCMMEDNEEEADDENEDATTTINNDDRTHLPNDTGADDISLPTKQRRARVVSRARQTYSNDRANPSDSDDNRNNDDDDDDEENTASSNSKSHITPLTASGPRLFGSLAAIESDDDDDDDKSTNVGISAVSSSTTTGNDGRPPPQQQQQSTAVVAASATEQPQQPEQDATKRRIAVKRPNKAMEVTTTTRTRTRRGQRNKSKLLSARYNDNMRDDDDGDASGDDDDDDDMEVTAFALSGLASSTSSTAATTLRNRRGTNRRRYYSAAAATTTSTRRRTINDDHDDDNDGSSSPELVYGQQY